ncbi:6-bladed beta-propeller [Algoriphagus halophytocola]|uniref:6-bladed beta-propeller n=1 Tax=Algoriphagus halophytocola TaxID=2991499 RepID=UPI0022DD98A8|nr:6-bladed beta-propeller [Algoriphagus sp. TR-M9]WBL43754.1 6-bladed beta-propeller [Algoriphagus sp. TR-M9]
MKNIYFNAFVFILLWSSCNLKDNNNDTLKNAIELDPTIGENVKMSEFFEDFDIVHPSEDELIGFVSDVLIYRDKIVITDRQILKNIQVFDKLGQHLFTINSKGAGPGEFKSPSIVRVSSSGNELLVYAGITKKFMKFDWNGNFISEISFNDIGLVGDFIEKNGEVVFLNVMTGNPSERVGKFNFNTVGKYKEITFFEDYPDEFVKIKARKSGYFFDTVEHDFFFFIDQLSGKLVSMDWNGFKDVHKFNLTINPLIMDSSKVLEPLEIKEQLIQNEYFRIGESVSSGRNYALLPIYKGVSDFSSLYFNLTNGRKKVISRFENDMDKLFPLVTFPSVAGSDPRKGILYIDPGIIYSRLSEIDLTDNPLKNKLRRLQTPENENPVLLIYTLKDSIDF